MILCKLRGMQKGKGCVLRMKAVHRNGIFGKKREIDGF